MLETCGSAGEGRNLHGLSSGDFVPALGQFLGLATGLSAPVITKLTEQWKAEQRAFAGRDLSGVDYVYLWADGIHVNIRLEEHKLCLLVMIGIRADGRKELVALVDGYRESTESWADLLRDCARRGMTALVLAVGDGALGFWGALREVFPATREQRCWFHKIAKGLSALPKTAHPGAKKALAEIWNAQDHRHALDAVKAFEAAYGAKFPKAVAKITDDVDELLAFYNYPAEHWIHLRTTNPIESIFLAVKTAFLIPGQRAGISPSSTSSCQKPQLWSAPDHMRGPTLSGLRCCTTYWPSVTGAHHAAPAVFGVPDRAKLVQ